MYNSKRKSVIPLEMFNHSYIRAIFFSLASLNNLDNYNNEALGKISMEIIIMEM